MHAFVEQVRRSGPRAEAARNKMTPPEAKAFKFEPDDRSTRSSGSRYEPQKLSDTQMKFSAYPPAGSTDTEILYNQYKPFQSAWIVFLTALVVIVLSGMLKSSRFVYASGLLITLAAMVFGVGFRPAGANCRAATCHQHVRDGDLGVVHRVGVGILVLRAPLHVARPELGLAAGRLAGAAPLGGIGLSAGSGTRPSAKGGRGTIRRPRVPAPCSA